MSNLREIKKEKTRQRILEALSRLREGKPTSMELKARKSVSVCINTVEIEAGLAVGGLRHYQDIVEGHNLKKSRLNKGGDKSTSEQKAKLNKLKGQLAEEKALKKKYYDKLQLANATIATKLSAQHELVIALYNELPREKRERLFDSGGDSNVVKFSKT